MVRQTIEDPSLTNKPLLPNQFSSVPPKQVQETSGYQNVEHNPQHQDEEILIKDWSDDDTEPGDDEGFNPTVHKIINENDELD